MISFDPPTSFSSNWELILPPSVIAAAGLSNLTVTADGIYIEDCAGRYDLIPFHELAALLADSDDTGVPCGA